MKRFVVALLLCVAVAAPLHAAEEGVADTTGIRYALGFGAGLQSGHGLQFGIARGVHATHLGLGLIYDDRDARFGYSIGLRYFRTLYAGPYNDTYGWSGGAITGNYREESSSHVTSLGAGLGIAFHAGLPIRIRIDSGLAAYVDKNFSDAMYYPALNLAVLYEW
jgi:hypothetical protein